MAIIYYTIDGTNINETLTNFPIGIDVSGTGFLSGVAPSAYQNLHVTVSGGTTECYTEIVIWKPSNDRVLLWTKIPILFTSENKVIKLEINGINNPYVGTIGTSAAQNVWDDDFIAVYHLSQSPTGSILDSTSNEYNLTSNGSMTNDDLVDIDFGKGIEFDGTDDVLKATGLSFSPSLSFPITFEVYGVANNSFIGTYSVPYITLTDESESNQFMVLALYDNHARLYRYNTTVAVADGTTYVASNETVNLAGRFISNTNTRLYLNGSYENSNIDNSALSTGIDSISIGGPIDTTPAFYSGKVGDVRYSNSDRSEAWIKATNAVFNNTLLNQESSSSSSSLSSSSSSNSSSNSVSNITKIHFWHYVLNEGGQPIQNAEIRFYLQDNPTIEAEIYTNEASISTTTCSNADIKTNNNGYFEFWIAGESEFNGYAHTQEFQLEWYKAGTKPSIIKNINPWPNALIWRDKNNGADRNYRNKFISDYLASKWWNHAYQIIPSASPHDIYPVDFSSGCDDNTYNKVVSNKFLYDILQGCYDGDSETIAYEGVTEYNEDVTSWTVSGDSYYIDINHSDIFNDCVIMVVDVNTLEEIIPKRIVHISSYVTRIFIDSNINVKIYVHGYSSSSSSSSI